MNREPPTKGEEEVVRESLVASYEEETKVRTSDELPMDRYEKGLRKLPAISF